MTDAPAARLGPMLHVTNPATEQRIASVACDTHEQVASKATAARAAQPSWAARPLADRVACIERFKSAVQAERDTLAGTLTDEMGKPIRQSRNELDAFVGRVDFFVDHVAAAIAPEVVLAPSGRAGDTTEGITHDPLGVVANISAWNYPYFVGGNVFVPALLTGNAVLYKPSEHATLSGLHMARLLHDAGVPDDVFIPIVGAGAVGAALLEQRIDGVFFTGSNATGARIAQALGPRLVKMQLELGGKDPTYVCDDADVRPAAASLADGAMYNTGQSCCSVERIYVHERVHDAFVEAFVAEVRGMRIGDPRDDDTYIGPIAREPQLAVLEAQVADAVGQGATLLVGGRRRPGPGWWFEPTVLVNVDHRMAVMRDESFGPIIGIQKVSGDDEAVALMNDTRYGLTAGIYTPDEARAARLLPRLNAGSVYWNCCDRVSPRLPWSGVGASGIGLTLSTYGIQAFTRPRAWHLRHV